ncbi:hypothetical protein, partial [Paenibacillus mucilaginosus]|uniref:hypothetical protein n=1 Tax=Paenibacillus mucilaginosus TaxID=61624 RepID=UPI003D22EC04
MRYMPPGKLSFEHNGTQIRYRDGGGWFSTKKVTVNASDRASIDSGHPLREFEIMDLNEEVFTWVNSGRD